MERKKNPILSILEESLVERPTGLAWVTEYSLKIQVE